MSELDDLVLPAQDVVVVLPDDGDPQTNTGTIVKSSSAMGNLFRGDMPYSMDNHILFVRELSVDIELDNINYCLMNKVAVLAAL